MNMFEDWKIILTHLGVFAVLAGIANIVGFSWIGYFVLVFLFYLALEDMLKRKDRRDGVEVDED